jgi:hypothetical protein
VEGRRHNPRLLDGKLNPNSEQRIETNTELILIGTAEGERKFIKAPSLPDGIGHCFAPISGLDIRGIIP